jgi:hypothetical protein
MPGRKRVQIRRVERGAGRVVRVDHDDGVVVRREPVEDGDVDAGDVLVAHGIRKRAPVLAKRRVGHRDAAGREDLGQPRKRL